MEMGDKDMIKGVYSATGSRELHGKTCLYGNLHIGKYLRKSNDWLEMVPEIIVPLPPALGVI